MLFQTHVEKPQAKIVLQADTHEQLNHILIALNRAVNAYQSSSQEAGKDRDYSESKTESAGARR